MTGTDSNPRPGLGLPTKDNMAGRRAHHFIGVLPGWLLSKKYSQSVLVGREGNRALHLIAHFLKMMSSR